MSSTMNVQVVAVDCAYHSAMVVIATECSRFLFEVGEGTQRLAIEHKVRIGKISAIFLTSAWPCSLGGLPGMLLTVADAGVAPQMDIYGPSNAKQVMSATRHFMRPLGNFHAITRSTEDAEVYRKRNEIAIYPVGLQASSDDQECEIEHVCYIAETALIPGKFYLDKAEALGVPKGPLCGKLKNGHAVTLDDGTVVTPAQVVGLPTPSKYVAIVCRIDVANERLQENLFTNATFIKYFVGDSSNEAEEQIVERFQIM
jgi:ribonuclease Z